MASEHIRAWFAQLHESGMTYLQTKILLSSLKELVSSGEVTGVEASKINKVLLFGDLNEYLDIQQAEHDFPLGDRALLGILKNPEYEQSVKLTDEEKQAVVHALHRNITKKIQLFYEVFGSFLENGSTEISEENCRKLVSCLKTAVSSTVMWSQQKGIITDIKKSYEEIAKCIAMLSNLVQVKLQGGEPLHSLVKQLNELNALATDAKSKELLGEMKNELLSDEGAAALEIIHSKQKEEIEVKKQELKRLREEVSLYESLRKDGFDDLLNEYLEVSHKRANKEKMKKDYVKGSEEVKEG